jgi:hypothetical protein
MFMMFANVSPLPGQRIPDALGFPTWHTKLDYKTRLTRDTETCPLIWDQNLG